jgi:exopolyphosphatase/guanosine-5'-triphosphate,3'-diphosphate pyrophosphatase
VKILLVRHAKALKRSGWKGSDRLRPITAPGHQQARRIASRLMKTPIQRIVCSPFLRCRQTVEPLAAARGLPLEIDERLAEGASISKALDLLRGLGDCATALCSHGDVIPALLCELEELGMEIEGELRCDKGSIWSLEGPAHAPLRARYLEPPSKRRADSPAHAPAAAAAAETQEDLEESRIAVLDCGSTSFHLAVLETTPDGDMRRVARERIMLRLGALIANGNEIPDEACKRAADTARQLRRIAVRAGAERLLPVATAALRDAPNGRRVADRITAAVDAPLRILGGAEEARLMFAAYSRRVALGPGLSLGIDLGGGSLELAIGDADGVRWETTLPLGVARLHQELVHEDPMPKKVARAVRKRVRAALAPHLGAIAQCKPSKWISSGGTAAALAQRIIARRGLRPAASLNELFILAAELEDLTAELVRSSHAQRLRLPGLQRRRADLLPTGALILSTLAGELEIEGYTLCDWGLREGVVLESLGLAGAKGSEAPVS